MDRRAATSGRRSKRSLSLIRQTQARGSLAGIEPASAYYLFMGAATSVFVMAPAYQLLTGRDPFSPERRAAHADALVRLFLPERTTRRRGGRASRGVAPRSQS